VSAEYVPDSADAGQTLKVRVGRAGYQGTGESGATEPVLPLGDGDFSYWPLHETVRYFSLSQKKELGAPKRHTAEWDLAIEAKGGFCYIYTNSGASAEAFDTGGQGGVWFTNKTDFDGAAFADRVTDFAGLNAEFETYVTDTERYQTGMDSILPVSMNLMTYHGYSGGVGTQADPFTFRPETPARPFYLFNRKGYTYSPAGMPPKWYPTGQVYVIRHADGTAYSKFQVTAITYISGYNFRVSFRFKNIEPAEGGPNPLMVPGLYTGTAYGYGSGPVTVAAALTETGVTQVTVTSHSETNSRPAVAAALTGIPQAIVSEQSLAADAVSGATFTSNAIIEAVKNCIFQAGDGRAAAAFGAASL
jgi:uncharacterized protein with FMN-binding domain